MTFCKKKGQRQTLSRLLFGLSFLILSQVHKVWGQSAEDITRLHQLLDVINPMVPPSRNLSQPVYVGLAVNLLSISQLDTASQTLTLVAWFSVLWNNDYLAWDPRDYGGAVYFNPEPQKVWRPPIVVLNTKSELEPIGVYQPITVKADGQTIWYPGDVISTTCHVDVTHFPFDSHVCEVTFINWNDAGGVVQLVPLDDQANLASFSESSEWELMETSLRADLLNGTKSDISVHGYGDTTASSLVLKLRLKRRPSLVLITALLPVAILAVINVIVFLIPCQSGERISFAVTILLSYGVFLTFVTAVMPSASSAMSILVTYLYVLFGFSAVFLVLSVVTVRMAHFDDNLIPAPNSLARFALCFERSVSKTCRKHRVAEAAKKNKGQNQNWIRDGDRDGQKQEQRCNGKNGSEFDPGMEDVTWERVVRAIDAFLFRFFAVLLLLISLMLLPAFSLSGK